VPAGSPKLLSPNLPALPTGKGEAGLLVAPLVGSWCFVFRFVFSDNNLAGFVFTVFYQSYTLKFYC
jgi:hypothetical protein